VDQQLETVMARRQYFDANDEGKTPIVEVEIGIPLPSPHAPNEFMCSFRIRTAGEGKIETVYGVDELQALQLALGYLAATLRRLSGTLGMKLHWIGDENGDLGIGIPSF
jgi:hypothetical protein